MKWICQKTMWITHQITTGKLTEIMYTWTHHSFYNFNIICIYMANITRFSLDIVKKRQTFINKKFPICLLDNYYILWILKGNWCKKIIHKGIISFSHEHDCISIHDKLIKKNIPTFLTPFINDYKLVIIIIGYKILSTKMFKLSIKRKSAQTRRPWWPLITHLSLIPQDYFK